MGGADAEVKPRQQRQEKPAEKTTPATLVEPKAC